MRKRRKRKRRRRTRKKRSRQHDQRLPASCFARMPPGVAGLPPLIVVAQCRLKADIVQGQIRPPLTRAPFTGCARERKVRAPQSGTPGNARDSHAEPSPACEDRECHRKQTPSSSPSGRVRADLRREDREGRVKRRGKSPPPFRQREGHGKPRSEQSQAAGGCSPAGSSCSGALRVGCTRARETAAPREMVVLDRTRLIDLPLFLK